MSCQLRFSPQSTNSDTLPPNTLTKPLFETAKKHAPDSKIIVGEALNLPIPSGYSSSGVGYG